MPDRRAGQAKPAPVEPAGGVEPTTAERVAPLLDICRKLADAIWRVENGLETMEPAELDALRERRNRLLDEIHDLLYAGCEPD